MLKVISTWVDSCAVCKGHDSQSQRLWGISLIDKRRSKQDSSYVDICQNCLPRFEKALERAKKELAQNIAPGLNGGK